MYNVLFAVGVLATTHAFSPEILKNFSNSTCTDKEFFCNVNECVPLSKQCDGHNDCSDSSDELDCELIRCLEPHYFRCANSRCISSAFVCDSENDCDDFSDEKNCVDFKKNFQNNATCRSNQWQCTDKLCIPNSWVCNGEPDCIDGSDEVIGCSASIRCDGFKCKNEHCIASEWRCDGQDDCRDNSDEENCDAQVDLKNCTPENGHFLCKDRKTCLKVYEACDNVPQCPDRSDEGAFCNNTCQRCGHSCVHLPTGPVCICPKGYNTIDEKHCEDINECEIFGICDQKCRNQPGSYECYCDKGYSLQSDKKSCKTIFGEPTLFFSSKKHIRAYSLRSELYLPVADNLKQVVGVDFDGEHVYWTDIFSEHESIVRSLKNGKEKELLVTAGLGAPEDLRVDFITKNIYFTDMERRHIGVCTNDGSHCAVIVNKEVHKPRGLVLDPLKGEMYWTDWGKRPEIGRASMDGSNDISFVSSEIKWPNGLTIDYPNERLYWTDAKLLTLESIKLDGTDRRIILAGIVSHPYAIAVFENRLYWSDWATRSIQSCDKFTGKDHHTLIKSNEYIYGISIYHPNLKYLPRENPCKSSLCSDICLLSGASYRCACSQNKQLGLDGHTCKSKEKKQKLMLATNDQLMEVQHQMLGKHEVFALSIPVKRIGALAYNSITNVLYLSDIQIRKIVEMNLHTGFSKTLDIDELGLITAMDYDYFGNNLYICDTERNTVEVINLRSFARTILLHDLNGESPQSIALVPEEGIMFVAFSRNQIHDSHVDRIFMDGTGRTHPLDHGLRGPISLTYDEQLHRIFIGDAGTGNIETTSVEGDDRHGFRSFLDGPVDITSLKSDVFWVTKNSKQIYWADKYNLEDEDYNRKITLDLPHAVEKMHILSITSKTVGVSPCQKKNGGCSDLCLQSQNRVVCACPVDMELGNDNRTCTRRVQCSEFFCSKSNTCVPDKFRCDGMEQCPHGEDEDDCKEPNHCPMDFFQCKDGECILKAKQCDNQYDCRDKSDEFSCNHLETSKCPPNHFKCKAGQCINERFVCDGLKDCPDAEDENHCVVAVCDNFSFRCNSGACIPKQWECDRDFDCPDNSDEHSGCVKCKSSDFSCSNGKCLNKTLVCNGENNCGDNSDEISCGKSEEMCDADEFLCSVHALVCLPHAARCNGTSECPHHEDELDCGSNCMPGEFTCKNKKCVPKEWVCDRSDDCNDNSDEDVAVCGEAVPLHHELEKACDGKFQCKNGNCIDFALICNGESNCFDGSDEEGACNTSCKALNNPCSHICVKTPTGPLCKCEEGFKLQGNGYSCKDVDECTQHPPVCSQICRNTEGKFICDCYDGFSLRTDRTTCKSKGKAMSLLYTFDNQVRELSQTDNSLSVVHSDDNFRFTSLEVSVKTNSLLLTLESSRVILMLDRLHSKKLYLEDVGQPQKLALDWMTDNIYFVNNEPHAQSISVCNFYDRTCSRLISIDHNRQVSALTVDAVNRVMFYSLTSWWMFNSLNYVIYKTNLDGSEKEELAKGSGYITGLTFDLYKKQLFFINQQRSELQSINYDGNDQTLLASNLSRPSTVRFFENTVFFLTRNSFGKCRLLEPVTCDFFKPDDISTNLFAIMQESVQPQLGMNLCQNHTCTHLCVPGKFRYKCLCENGDVIKAEEECNIKFREAESEDDRRKNVVSYRHEDINKSSSPFPVITGVMISLFLLSLLVVAYFLIRKRNSGSFDFRMQVRRRGDCLIREDSHEHEFVNAVVSHDPKKVTFVHV